MVASGGGAPGRRKARKLGLGCATFLVAVACGSVVWTGTALAFDAIVTWKTVSTASAYRIYVAHGDGAYELVDQAPPSTASIQSHVLVGLPTAEVTRFVVTVVGRSGGESAMSNERAIDYASVAHFADTDGDGLSDAEEDLDLDDIVDDGETDPSDGDSDGDGVLDFDERNICDGDTDCDGLLDGHDPCSLDARNRCFGEVATDRLEGLPIRINAGRSKAGCGGRRTDCNGDGWVADFGYRHRRGSRACTLPNECAIGGIEELWGCTDAATEDIFQCDHSSLRPARRIDYHFFLPNGPYLVNLYFANTQAETARPGDRVFNISVEGEMKYRRFDQMEVAGTSRQVVVRSALVETIDGNGIHITLRPRIGEVALKAIEILDGR